MSTDYDIEDDEDEMDDDIEDSYDEEYEDEEFEEEEYEDDEEVAVPTTNNTPGAFSIGDKVVVVGNTAAHGQPMGKRLTIKASHGPSHWYVNEVPQYFATTDLRLDKILREEVERELVKSRANLDTLMAKLDYLNNTKKKTIDEKDFRTWRLNQILEGEGSPNQKAIAIQYMYED